MKTSGQLEGRHAIREGYQTDSMGLQLDPGALYYYEGIRWSGITAMWRMGLKRPRTLVQVKKLTTLHGEQK